jgi:hypothetical protein
MRKDICLFAILSALMLTSVGGWTVFTISHVKAAFVKATNDAYRSTTIGGGLYFVPPPAY